MWLDIARDYTERWVHDQQIRDAVGRARLKDRRKGPAVCGFRICIRIESSR
jgi:hypothetical protein